MQPIIVPLTHTEVRRDPILGRDPWFENRGTMLLRGEEEEGRNALL